MFYLMSYIKIDGSGKGMWVRKGRMFKDKSAALRLMAKAKEPAMVYKYGAGMVGTNYYHHATTH